MEDPGIIAYSQIPAGCEFLDKTEPDTRPLGTFAHGTRVCMREKGKFLKGTIRQDDIVANGGSTPFLSVNIEEAYRGDRPSREFAFFSRRDIAVIQSDEPTTAGSIKKRVTRRGRKLVVTRRRRTRGRKLHRLRGLSRHGRN